MLGLPDSVRACLFDLDGVLTQTAAVHAAAWKEMFDAYLRERSERTGELFMAFEPVADYDTYVDGKPRADGTRSFLQSRGIALADAIDADDKTETSSAAGLDTRQGIFEHRRLRRHYVQRTSRGEVRVRSRFSLQTVPLGDESVDARVEIIDDAGRDEYRVGVCARGHDCATQTCGACRPQIPQRAGENRDAGLPEAS